MELDTLGANEAGGAGGLDLGVPDRVAGVGPPVVERLGDGPIIVAADGSGDYTTIQAAMDAAVEGTTIKVQPGTYVEALVLEKDIVIAGQGDGSEVVIEPPPECPQMPTRSPRPSPRAISALASRSPSAA